MALDIEKVESSINKLRKLLKRLPELPSPDEVHKLRTQTRRVEAMVHAFGLDREPDGRRLLKVLKPVRKAAGAVRDLDVFVGFGLETAQNQADMCAVRLVEALGTKRQKLAGKLSEEVGARRRRARRLLKLCREWIEANVGGDGGPGAGDASGASGASTDGHMRGAAMATALGLATELRDWPRLSRGNLHSYRLKVKELRYTLELAKATGGSEPEFVKALTEVKDAIGAWHDWQELVYVAGKILDDERCAVMVQIRGRAKQEFVRAMATTNAMRGRFLEPEEVGRGKKSTQGDFSGALMKDVADLGE